MNAAAPRASHGTGEVLAAGWSLFKAGLSGVFPWVLAAELVQLLPFADAPGGFFDTDLSLFTQPGYLVWALLCGAAQTMLYAVAVLRLGVLAGAEPSGRPAWDALRAVPAVMIAYLVYELVVAFGLVLTFIMFVIGLFIAGPLFGLVLCVLPLAPTAAVSTALALFIFTAVLERRGPFAALGESSRLAKTRWAQVTLVISVPAVALLAASLLGHWPQVVHFTSRYLDLVRQAQEGGISVDQLQGLAEGSKAPVTGQDGWRIAGTLLGAFAWWYTLAVCYAQYRSLKRPD